MSQEDPEVRFGYGSSTNVSFQGTIQSGWARSEWNALSDKEKDNVMDEAVWDLVDLYVLNDTDPDVY